MAKQLIVTYSTLLDSNLIARYQRGDTLAFEELFDRYHEKILQWIKNRGIESNLVDDFSQDVWMRMARYLATFKWKSEGQFYKWIKGKIIRQVISKHFQKKSNQEVPSAFSDTVSNADVPHNHGGGKQLADRALSEDENNRKTTEFWELLETLTPDEQDLIIRKHVLEQSNEKIARAIGVSQPTAAKRLRRIYEKLRLE